MKTCVYSRFVFDLPYLNYWIEHYLNLKFDYIVILFFEYKYKDILNIKNKLIDDNVLDKKFNTDNIIIKLVDNNIVANELYFEYKKYIPLDVHYLLQCDSDEYLLINDKYKCIKNLLKIKCSNVKSKTSKTNTKVNLNNIVTLGLSWTWNKDPFNYDILNQNVYTGKKGGMFKKGIFYKYIIKIDDKIKKSKCKHPIHGQCDFVFDIKDAQLLHLRQRGFNNILLKFMHYNKELKGMGISHSSAAKLKSGNFTEMFNFIINFNLSNKKDIINKLKELNCFGYDMKLKENISEYIQKNMNNKIKNNNFSVSNKSIEQTHYDEWFEHRLKTNNYSDENIYLFIKNIHVINKILHQ